LNESVIIQTWNTGISTTLHTRHELEILNSYITISCPLSPNQLKTKPMMIGNAVEYIIYSDLRGMEIAHT